MIASLVNYINLIARVVEFTGVLIMFLGLLFALYKAILSIRNFTHGVYVEIRQAVGRSILLGLEVLIAADIMATVVTKPTLNSVLVLGFIVLIRTFLSLSLQVELEGRFPWQKKLITPEQKPPTTPINPS
ncbi:DUF1622 domain-containing protein [Psychrobacter urativorans]|uniref:DUF1622 domain-containing protein n=1 Tax=Psychrobacter urativorans TaxID=45610 RepID=A0A0M4T6F1_9GAMM|nr:DUF1622 domain-containing protein [Psychrobacter urativorans]ALF59009.1 hypothetical protein AOC03_02205 [Psychrobacter urativorans]